MKSQVFAFVSLKLAYEVDLAKIEASENYQFEIFE